MMMQKDKFKILINEPYEYSKLALSEYARIGTVVLNDNAEYATFSSRDVKVLVVRLGFLIDANFLNRYPNLRFIVSPTTGLNHIDLETCQNRSIEVISLKGETAFLNSISATSELALGLMLALIRYIPVAHQSVVNNFTWNRDQFTGRMVSRLTVGIIGLGRLGCQMAKICKLLGMNVLANDPYVDKSVFSGLQVESVEIYDLAAKSDVISIHANYTPENDCMINDKLLSHCKHGVLIINTSRGELCDEKTLVKEIISGKIGGLAIDVLRDEQGAIDFAQHPLVKLAKKGANIIITPHLGGCCRDAMNETEEFAARKLLTRLGYASK